jgi:hypothetical protein
MVQLDPFFHERAADRANHHFVVVDEQDHRICALVIHERSGHFRETL